VPAVLIYACSRWLKSKIDNKEARSAGAAEKQIIIIYYMSPLLNKSSLRKN
jgi:hypothetical protein